MLGPIGILLGPREKEPIVFSHIRAFFATSGWSEGGREYKDQMTFYCSLCRGHQSWFLLAASRVLMWQHNLQRRFRRIHSVTKECQLTPEWMSEEGLEIVTSSYLVLSHSKEEDSVGLSEGGIPTWIAPLLTSFLSVPPCRFSHPTPLPFPLEHLQPSVLTSLGKPHIFSPVHSAPPWVFLSAFLQNATFTASVGTVGFLVPSFVIWKTRLSPVGGWEMLVSDPIPVQVHTSESRDRFFHSLPEKQATSTKWALNSFWWLHNLVLFEINKFEISSINILWPASCKNNNLGIT